MLQCCRVSLRQVDEFSACYVNVTSDKQLCSVKSCKFIWWFSVGADLSVQGRMLDPPQKKEKKGCHTDQWPQYLTAYNTICWHILPFTMSLLDSLTNTKKWFTSTRVGKFCSQQQSSTKKDLDNGEMLGSWCSVGRKSFQCVYTFFQQYINYIITKCMFKRKRCTVRQTYKSRGCTLRLITV